MHLNVGTVAIICGQPVARAGLEQVVRECPGLEVGASAASYGELVEADPVRRFAVVVIDLPTVDLPDPPARAIGRLATIGAPVVVSRRAPAVTPLAAIRAGARAVVSRYTDPAAVRRAIGTAAEGGLSIAPDLVAGFLADLNRPAHDDRRALAPREAEMLRWITLGYTRSQIADRMGLLPATVNTYAKRIRGKLNVTDPAGSMALRRRRRNQEHF